MFCICLVPPTTVKPYIYHNYNSITTLLEKLANKCPSIAKLSSIGKSKKGKPIWSLQLSSKTGNGSKPSVGLVASLQGKDVIGSEMLLTFLEYLCIGYTRNNARIVKILTNTKVHVIPMIDVDGRSLAKEGDCKGTVRPQDDLTRAFSFETNAKQKRSLTDKMSSVSKMDSYVK